MARSLGIYVVLTGCILATTCSAQPTTTPTTTPTTPPAPAPCTGPSCWYPALDSRWQYQLQGVAAHASTGGINVPISRVPSTGGTPVGPSVFDIDLYIDPKMVGNNTTINTAALQAIHAEGGKAICYLSAGTFEPWRPDAASYPDPIKGKPVSGFEDERWLDIRRTNVLLPIMETRVAKCRGAGFDGVEWDNVDAYSNDTGFPLTASDQLSYNATLANLAHAHGLTVALKNDIEQLVELAPYFDFAINEQCDQYRECGGYTASFIREGKAVFQVEYELGLSKFCPHANAANRNAIRKTYDLFDTPWTACR